MEHTDLISVVVPFYNEEENIETMYRSLRSALDDMDTPYELLFVDDGSRDATFRIAKALARNDRQLRVIKFRRNYGQTPAMMAGIDHARGQVVVTMDGDLQNDPTDIPLFIAKIREGYDIVVGWRHKRQDKLITRKIPSKIANAIIGRVTGVPIRDNGCSLKAYRAEVIRNVPLYSEMHRFIPAMLSLSGVKIAELKVKHHPRRFGKSKYGLSRIFKVLSDLLTIKTLITFTSRPLVWFGYLSIPGFLISAGIFAWTFAQGLAADTGSLVVPYSISMVFATFSLFLLFCGVLCELVYNTGSLKMNDLSKITSSII